MLGYFLLVQQTSHHVDFKGLFASFVGHHHTLDHKVDGCIDHGLLEAYHSTYRYQYPTLTEAIMY